MTHVTPTRCFLVHLDLGPSDRLDGHVTAKNVKLTNEKEDKSALVMTAEKCTALLGKRGTLELSKMDDRITIIHKLPFRTHLNEGYKQTTIELPARHAALASTQKTIADEIAQKYVRIAETEGSSIQPDEKAKIHQKIAKIHACFEDNQEWKVLFQHFFNSILGIGKCIEKNKDVCSNFSTIANDQDEESETLRPKASRSGHPGHKMYVRRDIKLLERPLPTK
jgi:hypothetical protein